ncbi:MAG: hypothetical protein K8R57_07395 [Verrucomicrobia bacterium]|nr:hypothetical protein [Verrucomicrobiota bacterium]
MKKRLISLILGVTLVAGIGITKLDLQAADAQPANKNEEKNGANKKIISVDDEPICYRAAFGEVKPPVDETEDNSNKNKKQGYELIPSCDVISGKYKKPEGAIVEIGPINAKIIRKGSKEYQKIMDGTLGKTVIGKEDINDNSIEVVPQLIDSHKIISGYTDNKNKIVVTGIYGNSKVIRIWSLETGKLIRTISLMAGMDSQAENYDFIRKQNIARVYPYGDGKSAVIVRYQERAGGLSNALECTVTDLNTGNPTVEARGSSFRFDDDISDVQKKAGFMNVDFDKNTKLLVSVGGDMIKYDILKDRSELEKRLGKFLGSAYLDEVKIDPQKIGFDGGISLVAVDIKGSFNASVLARSSREKYLVLNVDLRNKQVISTQNINTYISENKNISSNIYSFINKHNALFSDGVQTLIKDGNTPLIISNKNKKSLLNIAGETSDYNCIVSNKNESLVVLYNDKKSDIMIIDQKSLIVKKINLPEGYTHKYVFFNKSCTQFYLATFDSVSGDTSFYSFNDKYEISKTAQYQLQSGNDCIELEANVSSSGRFFSCSLDNGREVSSYIVDSKSNSLLLHNNGPVCFMNNKDVAICAEKNILSEYDCANSSREISFNVIKDKVYNVAFFPLDEFHIKNEKYKTLDLQKSRNSDFNNVDWSPFRIDASPNGAAWSVSYKYHKYKPDDINNRPFLILNYKNKFYFDELFQDKLNVFISDDGSICRASHDVITPNMHWRWVSPYRNQEENPFKYNNITWLSDINKYYHLSSLGMITKIDFNQLKPKVDYSIFPSNNGNVVFVLKDKSYMLLGKNNSTVAFADKLKSYPLEQFDLRLNRPDIVLDRLGAPKEAVEAAKSLREKRLKRMGVTEEMLKPDFHLPELQIVGDVPATTSKDLLDLQIKATDDKYPLDRLRVYVNNVPVNGRDGELLRDQKTQSFEKTIPIKLAAGRNKIQLSVLNSAGAESLYANAEVNCTAERPKPMLYAVALGVSQYDRPEWCLKYAAKDATDLIGKLKAKSGSSYSEVKPLLLTDKEVTKESAAKIKEFLSGATIDDTVLIFMAGHGLLDDKYDYYFGTTDIDPAKPSERGMPYEAIDTILAEVPSLKKALLMDTCHAGELDEDEKKDLAASDGSATPAAIPAADTNSSPMAGKVAMRAIGTRGMSVKALQGAKGKSDWYEKLQDMFVDLRRGSGATVISSSQGAEYAFESSEQSNGLFTYSLMEALDGKATPNKDGQITISSIGDYVKKRVQDLTKGKQNPNLRGVNLEEDFSLGKAENFLPSSSTSSLSDETSKLSEEMLPDPSALPKAGSLETDSSFSQSATGHNKVLEFDEALSRADAGDAYAQGVLSIYYGLGYKTEKELAKAVEYASKSAGQNNPLGQYQLGVLTAGGEGVEKDPEKGKSLKVESIEGLNTMPDDPYALASLGAMALRGEGVAKDIKMAAKLYRSSADLGYAPAQILYSMMLARGVGVPPDASASRKYASMAEAQNYQP